MDGFPMKTAGTMKVLVTTDLPTDAPADGTSDDTQVVNLGNSATNLSLRNN